jgi:hypothetical protein
MATPEYFEPLPLVNYVRVVALTPDLLAVSFYGITEFSKNSSTIYFNLLGHI